MTHFRQEWDTETAMEILNHPTVDSKVWAEAVEWLLIYGPQEIQEMLKQASGHATKENFPELNPLGYGKDGTPCYSLSQLANSLGISEEEAEAIIAEKEEKHGMCHRVEKEDTTSLQ